jgi:hypothetical protein
MIQHPPAYDPALPKAVLPDPARTPYGYDYFALRGGLSNCRIRFEKEMKGRVAFLGGSITAMEGWRGLAQSDLVRRFPETDFDFIDAGIPSLGSTPHAFRFSRDVLARGPVDLLFLEAAVNDEANGQTALEMLRGMEGVVLQARMSNPAMDIIMLHFADPSKLSAIGSGGTPLAIEMHERVADHYGLPSIDLAREVWERIHAGEFEWDKDFVDLHPSPFGHSLYAASIARLFDRAWGAGGERHRADSGADAPRADADAPHADADAPRAGTILEPYDLPPALDENSYFRGRFVGPEQGLRGKGWALCPCWEPDDGIATRMGFFRVPALVSDDPGSECAFDFEGTAVGIFVAAGPDAGIVEYRVDHRIVGSRNLFTRWSSALHLPWAQVLAADLEPGKHRLTLRIAEHKDPASRGHAVRILHILAN